MMVLFMGVILVFEPWRRTETSPEEDVCSEASKNSCIVARMYMKLPPLPHIVRFISKYRQIIAN